ncbi:hypothetical protein ACS0TY_028750 [Phlomoides rotata]
MGDSTCLLHGFSYASAIPNEYKQGNPIHILGESISFGRYTSESLSWEKWSSFSHKKYVEEAERYAQPGSVAQKKAFFEAHYKRIAAQKAAALLEQQQNAAALAAQNEEAAAAAAAAAAKDNINIINDDDDDDGEEEEEEESVLLNSYSNVDDERDDSKQDLVKTNEQTSLTVVEPAGKEEEICVVNQDTISVSETSGSTLMERPLLKNCDDSEEVTSKRRSSPSSLKTSILHKTWRVPSTPAKQQTPTHFKNENNSTRKSNVESLNYRRSSSPMSLRDLLNLVHSKEPDKQPVYSSQSSSRQHKDCSTPFKTPAQASTRSASTYPAATPRSENRRMRTPIDSSATGRKTSGPKWHILSAVCPKSLSSYRNKLQSPTVSTPFTLRTAERAARRKQKLEEKFNSSEAQKIQLQKTFKEKAGNELRKLSCCFKARPLPEFYKERETPNNHMKKTPVAAEPQTMELGRSISKKKQGTVSLPPPSPPSTCLANNASVYKNLSQTKNVLNQTKLLNRSLHERIAQHENASPNIHH